MSWEAQAWTARKSEDYELDGTTRAIFKTLGEFADKNGENIFPSLSTLERKTGWTERTVRRSIKKLLAVGLLDYGDQSVVRDNPKFRNDQLPKVYRLVFNRDEAGLLDFTSFGRVPQPTKKRRPWSRKPKPAAPPAVVDNPVDNPAPKPERPDILTRTPGQTPGHNVQETFKPLNEPLADTAGTIPASQEVIDYAAVHALRQAARDRLARRGIHITAPLSPAPKPAAQEAAPETPAPSAATPKKGHPMKTTGTTNEIMWHWATETGIKHDLDGHTRLVLSRITNHFPGIGRDVPLPSPAELAADTGLRVPEVSRQTQILIDRGILERTGLGIYRLTA